MNNDIAAQGFVETICDYSLTKGIESVSAMLKRPFDSERAEWVKLSAWYNALNDSDKENINVLVRERIIDSLTSVFVVLDRVGGGSPIIEEKPCEFELSVKEYDWDNEANIDTQKAVSHIIAPPQRGEYLHDIFLNMVDSMYNK